MDRFNLYAKKIMKKQIIKNFKKTLRKFTDRNNSCVCKKK